MSSDRRLTNKQEEFYDLEHKPTGLSSLKQKRAVTSVVMQTLLSLGLLDWYVVSLGTVPDSELPRAANELQN